MKQASVHSQSLRPAPSRAQQRSIAGPAGITIAPPAYGIDFVDRQPSIGGGMTVQRQVGETDHTSKRQQDNRTGLPNQLKAGIESLSGLSLENVRVHYNSTKPAALQALAYTQGMDIHVAPGQEQHLPHEAWHVVQQAQGRVQPRFQLKGEQINNDRGLEHEADVMGTKALQIQGPGSRAVPGGPAHVHVPPTTMAQPGIAKTSSESSCRCTSCSSSSERNKKKPCRKLYEQPIQRFVIQRAKRKRAASNSEDEYSSESSESDEEVSDGEQCAEDTCITAECEVKDSYDSNGQPRPLGATIRGKFYPGFTAPVLIWKQNRLAALQGGCPAGEFTCPHCHKCFPNNQSTIDHDIPVAQHWNTVGRHTSQVVRGNWYSHIPNLEVVYGPHNSSMGSGGVHYLRDVTANFTGGQNC